MKKTIRFLTFVLFFTATIEIHSVASSTLSSKSAAGDSLSKKRNGFIFIPALFYTPETKVAGGVSLMYYFRSASSSLENRPSTLSPTFIYTQRKQIISQLFADFYWQDETYHLLAGGGYIKFPDKFYSIGHSTPKSAEEDYTPRKYFFLLNMQKKLHHAWHVGLLYEITDTKITETEENGQLSTSQILGADGGIVGGFGLVTNWDSRDNIFNPTQGEFYQFSATFFKSPFGSDYDFNRYNFDLRKYFRFRSSDVFALQVYMNFVTGKPPFQMLSLIGGQNLMRGYYEGRYRDKNLLIWQSEYRLPVWKRFGVVAFAGLGDVAAKLSGFEIDRFKYSYGWGLRYLFSRNEGLNIRFDFGFGKDSSGFYITLGEAF
ncbi:MAG: BamA/TamA family outer membrane protein [bacterium]